MSKFADFRTVTDLHHLLVYPGFSQKLHKSDIVFREDIQKSVVVPFGEYVYLLIFNWLLSLGYWFPKWDTERER